jgi:hypothetical protein
MARVELPRDLMFLNTKIKSQMRELARRLKRTKYSYTNTITFSLLIYFRPRATQATSCRKQKQTLFKRPSK